MKEKAACAVNDMMFGCELTPKTRNLTICLRLILDIKVAEYYVMESLMFIMPLQAFKVEEEVLSEEFGSLHSQAHSEFRHLVPMRMRKEDKLLQVDLKPFYMQEVNLYNTVVPDSEESITYCLIPVDLPFITQVDSYPRTSSTLSREMIKLVEPMTHQSS